MVGLAFVMVAIAGEMAWHVNQASGADRALLQVGQSVEAGQRLGQLPALRCVAGMGMPAVLPLARAFLAVPTSLQEWFYVEVRA